MREEMERDPQVFVMGEDVGQYEGAFKVTRGLLREFGERRVVDTPISEAGFVGIGIGAAMAGLRPVVEMMTVNFSILALDQIVNNAAKVRYMFGGQVACPIVIRMPGGAGHQLAAQHSHSLEAWYSHVPGLKVAVPSTPFDAKGLLKTSIRDDDPVIFLESEGLYAKKGPVGGPDELVPLGRAAVRRRGDDCTVIALSRMVWVALSAAEALAQEGDRGRGDRPAHAAAARPRDARRQRPPHRARRRRRGGLARVGGRGQPRRPPLRGLLRLARRADRARHGRRRARCPTPRTWSRRRCRRRRRSPARCGGSSGRRGS